MTTPKPSDEAVERALSNAYAEGAQAVHMEWRKYGVLDRTDEPDFAEAANDYAAAAIGALSQPEHCDDEASEADKATEAKYHELLYAVSMKHHGETRHETALRYIRQAEMWSGSATAMRAARKP